MALSNIADITRSMVTLIEWALRVSGDWPVGGVPKVFPLPPDKLTEDGIGLFLYHVQENEYNKNMHLQPTGSNQPPVQSAPMGLNLFYQLSAKASGDTPDSTDPFQEQLMMSIAIKALHDFPEINDTTELEEPPGPSINIFDKFNLKGQNNRFKISLQPIAHNDSVHFWTAGQSPLRLAAYYAVSVVFLEPKVAPMSAGRVLTYGTYIFTEGAPQITTTQNTLSFTIPGGAGLRQIDLQPAQITPGSQLHFLGTGFSGDRVELRLFNDRSFFNSGAIDPATGRLSQGSAVVDPSWLLTLSGDTKLSVTVQETISFPGAMPPISPIPILPGFYRGQVNVIRRRALPNGQIREFKNVSNQFPFTISPRIDSIAGLVANTETTVTGYGFDHADLPKDAVEVYVGANRLSRKNSGALDPGEFRVAASNQLDFLLPAGLSSGNILPLRIIVAGAESPPNWITTP